MNRRCFLGLPVVTWMTGLGQDAHAAREIAVIVNRQNPVSKLSEGELAAIFLTKRLYWSEDHRILAFNAPARNPARVAFDRKVLGMDPDEVARYWIDRRVRGGHRPPRQLSSWALMLKVIAGVEGAIGYVPTSDVDDSVKVLMKVVA